MKKESVKNYARTFEPEVVKMAESAVALGVASFVALMPDTHIGKGCAIGYTAKLEKRVVPNFIGVDIGCGLLLVRLGKIDFSNDKLKDVDHFIKHNVPHGFRINQNEVESDFDYTKFKMPISEERINRYKKSLGSLGGGNHFIEINKNKDGEVFLLIHTGSRSMGHDVNSYYQNLAWEDYKKMSVKLRSDTIQRQKLIDPSKISEVVKEAESKIGLGLVNKENAFLEGVQKDNYLHDMRIAQRFAVYNRLKIAEKIFKHIVGRDMTAQDVVVDSIHNFIGDDDVTRKGATSAKKGELLVVPINMAFGTILAIGKGNKDWNESAPHGAGRLLSRSRAKKELSLEKAIETMKNNGVFSTTLTIETLDEAPETYKSGEEIIELTKDTMDVVEVLKPIYNFKGGQD